MYQSSGWTRFNPTKRGIGFRQFESQHHLREHLLAGQATKNLIKEAHGDPATRRSIFLAALHHRAHPQFIQGELLTRALDDLLHPGVHEFLAHPGEIIDPADLGSQLRGGVAIRSVHQLDILKMIVGGAGGGFGDGVSIAIDHRRKKLVESGKEVVVARFFLGPPVTHGPGVNQRVVKDMVVVGATGGGLAGKSLAGDIAGRCEDVGGCAVNAHSVRGGIVDQVLRVNRARQMIVQIAALRHAAQKSQQEGWFLPDRLHVLRSSLLNGGSGLCRRDCQRQGCHEKPPGHTAHHLLLRLPESGIVL